MYIQFKTSSTWLAGASLQNISQKQTLAVYLWILLFHYGVEVRLVQFSISYRRPRSAQHRFVLEKSGKRLCPKTRWTWIWNCMFLQIVRLASLKCSIHTFVPPTNKKCRWPVMKLWDLCNFHYTRKNFIFDSRLQMCVDIQSLRFKLFQSEFNLVSAPLWDTIFWYPLATEISAGWSQNQHSYGFTHDSSIAVWIISNEYLDNIVEINK